MYQPTVGSATLGTMILGGLRRQLNMSLGGSQWAASSPQVPAWAPILASFDDGLQPVWCNKSCPLEVGICLCHSNRKLTGLRCSGRIRWGSSDNIVFFYVFLNRKTLYCSTSIQLINIIFFLLGNFKSIFSIVHITLLAKLQWKNDLTLNWCFPLTKRTQ